MLDDDKNPQNNNSSFSSPVFCMLFSFGRKDLAFNSFRVSLIQIRFIQVRKSIGTISTISTNKCYKYKSSPILRNILPSNKKKLLVNIEGISSRIKCMKFLLASGKTTGDYNISKVDISLGFHLLTLRASCLNKV